MQTSRHVVYASRQSNGYSLSHANGPRSILYTLSSHVKRPAARLFLQSMLCYSNNTDICTIRPEWSILPSRPGLGVTQQKSTYCSIWPAGQMRVET